MSFLVGCGGKALVPRYDDLILSERFTSAQPLAAPAEVFCADELRFALALADGQTISAEIEVDETASLTVSGCLGWAGEGGRDAGVTPAIVAEVVNDRGDVLLQERLPLPNRTARFEHTLPLGRLPPGRVSVRLAGELGSERQAYLRDVVVRREARLARRSSSPRQVLLISVDTWRSDAISALGGPWPTPALDRFVARSQVFSNHLAAASWTKPSHGSLLTGQPAPVHGAASVEGVVARALPLVAERFRGAGFRTAGMVFDCAWLDPRFGFDRGFETYVAKHWTPDQAVRQAGGWMVDHRDEPFFFFLHTFDPHSDFHRLPYEAPGVRAAEVARRFGLEDYGCREQACASLVLERLGKGELVPLAREAEILRHLYGEGARNVDTALGRLFEGLESAGMLDNLLVVLTSDHGEALLDHGATLHGHPWREVTEVPLVVHWPGDLRAGERVVTPTSALDVVPTLLAAAGLPADDLPGQSLGDAPRPRPVFSWSEAWDVVVAGPTKAILRADGSASLYDRAADPNEERDLAAVQPERVAEARRLLAARRAAENAVLEALRSHGFETRSLSEEEKKRLRALGYLGGSTGN